MFIWLKRLIILLLLAIVAIVATGYWWLHHQLPIQQQLLEVEIVRGSSTKTVANKLVASGIQTPELLLYTWLRLSGKSTAIKAGNYEIKQQTTPLQLMEMLVSGRQAMRSIRLLEGWTMRQFREEIAKSNYLRHDTAELTNQQIMAKLGRPNMAAEGQFFPDTYLYAKNSSDIELFKQAYNAMQKHLEVAWQMRAKDLPLKNSYELLILASIVEKETGADIDRYMVAGVFSNRLRLGMLLQTDPTVVYGVSEAHGQAFDGKIRYKHLRDKNSWNTYIQPGLPPTPIAMPSNASLLAAASPAITKSLYFVAKGGGQSHFSESLTQHNQAVNRYILNKKKE